MSMYTLNWWNSCKLMTPSWSNNFLLTLYWHQQKLLILLQKQTFMLTKSELSITRGVVQVLPQITLPLEDLKILFHQLDKVLRHILKEKILTYSLEKQRLHVSNKRIRLQPDSVIVHYMDTLLLEKLVLVTRFKEE